MLLLAVGVTIPTISNQQRKIIIIEKIVPSLIRIHDKHVPSSMPHLVKSTQVAASLSSRELVISICPKASQRLDCLQGSFTALMCFDSVIEEQRPFGVLNTRINWM